MSDDAIDKDTIVLESTATPFELNVVINGEEKTSYGAKFITVEKGTITRPDTGESMEVGMLLIQCAQTEQVVHHVFGAQDLLILAASLTTLAQVLHKPDKLH